MGFIRAVCAATAFTAPMCTYTYAARHVSTDSVVNVTRGGDWIFRWLASLLSLTFPKSFFPTRTHAVVLHIVDSSDGDSKEFPSGV